MKSENPPPIRTPVASVLERSYRHLDDPEMLDDRSAVQRRHQARPHSQPNALCMNRSHVLYVCKKLPGSRTAKEAAKHWQGVFAFMNKLRRDGIPVGLPVLTRQRAPVAHLRAPGTGAASSWSLTRHYDQTPFVASRRQVETLAKTLAHAHDASATWRTGHRNLVPGNLFCTVQELAEVSTQELLQKHFIRNDQAAGWMDFSGHILGRLKILEEQARRAGYMTRHLAIHGDFHPKNALFSRASRSSAALPRLIDFDCARLDDPLDDLARGILHLEIFDLKGGLPSPRRIERSKDSSKRFMDAYCRHLGAPSGPPASNALWLSIFEAVSWQLIILYFLKRLAHAPEAIESAKATVASLMEQVAPIREEILGVGEESAAQP